MLSNEDSRERDICLAFDHARSINEMNDFKKKTALKDFSFERKMSLVCSYVKLRNVEFQRLRVPRSGM